MKKYRLIVSLAFVTLSVGLAIAASPKQQIPQTEKPLATASATHGAKAPAQKINADQLYKINCTRCHSEVPKVDVRQTATIMRHMRVRANIPKDDAQAIFEYLKQ